jgi:hypothetical protein
MAMQDRISEGRRRLAGYLTENQTTLSDKLSRAESVANRQTKDRYQPQVAKARSKAEEVIAKLAQPPS